jgi:demethylmenaquinone methyltransferase/2-methoxy-6-polyprenyl-1,4-benzoquinol methylase
MAHGDAAIFDRFARLYDIKPPTRTRKLQPGLDAADRPIERVIDVGGGTGQGVRALDVPTGIVVDAAPGMLTGAREHGVPGIRGDARSLPVPDATVDAVLLLDALHHMPDGEQVIADAARVLRPGGVLVVLEFDPTTILGRLLRAAEHLFGFDSTFFSANELAAIMRAAGLDVTSFRTGFEYGLAGVN